MIRSRKTLFLLISIIAIKIVCAQSYPPVAKIYGATAFQDSMWSFDANTYAVIDRISPSLAGYTVTGINGLAEDPCSHKIYAIVKISSTRVLTTINLTNGECTLIDTLNDRFSSITFTKNGQLLGVTGNGATDPESLFSIDKATGIATKIVNMGNGADGEVICYNPFVDSLYHWSGGTCFYEKVKLDSPYSFTSISSTFSREVFGALLIAPDTFLISDISSQFKKVDTLGNFSADLATTPDDIRGMVMPSVFASNKDTFCPKYDTVKIGAAGVRYKTLYYHWGDGKIDTVIGGSASHVYTSGTSYTIHVLGNNSMCLDTLFSKKVIIKNLPTVTITGNSYLCGTSSTLLTGSSGGSSQWYQNGSPITGATTNTYMANSVGAYNMTKKNSNGCYDSSAIAKIILQGNATSSSFPASICANTSYMWNGISQTTAGSYLDTLVNFMGCDSIVTLNLSINPLASSSFPASICANQSYVWNGVARSVSGAYLDTFVTSLGCDSFVTLNLTVNPISNSSKFDTILPNLPYVFNGVNLSTSGIYFDTFSNSNGCDSIVTLNLLVVQISSLSNDPNSQTIEIYPNPVRSILNVRFDRLSKFIGQVRIRSIEGKIHYQSSYKDFNNDLSIPIHSYPKGLYLLEIIDKNGVIKKTFVKE